MCCRCWGGCLIVQCSVHAPRVQCLGLGPAGAWDLALEVTPSAVQWMDAQPPEGESCTLAQLLPTACKCSAACAWCMLAAYWLPRGLPTVCPRTHITSGEEAAGAWQVQVVTCGRWGVKSGGTRAGGQRPRRLACHNPRAHKNAPRLPAAWPPPAGHGYPPAIIPA